MCLPSTDGHFHSHNQGNSLLGPNTPVHSYIRTHSHRDSSTYCYTHSFGYADGDTIAYGNRGAGLGAFCPR